MDFQTRKRTFWGTPQIHWDCTVFYYVYVCLGWGIWIHTQPIVAFYNQLLHFSLALTILKSYDLRSVSFPTVPRIPYPRPEIICDAVRRGRGELIIRTLLPDAFVTLFPQNWVLRSRNIGIGKCLGDTTVVFSESIRVVQKENYLVTTARQSYRIPLSRIVYYYFV